MTFKVGDYIRGANSGFIYQIVALYAPLNNNYTCRNVVGSSSLEKVYCAKFNALAVTEAEVMAAVLTGKT